MANADTVTDVLVHAGFGEIRLARQDLPYRIGNDLDQAIEFNMDLGPAAEVLRMWGDRIDEIRPEDRGRPARGARRLRPGGRLRGGARLDLGNQRARPA